MSNRRRRRPPVWQPWTQRDTPLRDRLKSTVGDDGRVSVVAHGADAGVVACIEAFAKAGATAVAFGWSAPGYEDVDDAPPGVEVTWWFEVTTASGAVQRGESQPTADHPRGVLEAACVILRAGGATAVVQQPGAN